MRCHIQQGERVMTHTPHDDNIPANDPAEAPASVRDRLAQPTISKKTKILSGIFNIAAGAGLTAAAKAAVVASMTWAAAPAVATLLISSLAVGATMTAFCHYGQKRAAKKSGAELPAFFSKTNAKVFAKSSLFAMVGGALFLGFSEGVFDKLFGSTPAPAALPVAPDCPPAADRVADVVANNPVTAEVKEAFARSASTNGHVAAQGTKDLAYYAFNAKDGMPKDPTLALALFKDAAEAGNVQAKVDLLYLQYHGLSGVPANPEAALAAMQDIKSPRAAWFVENWSKIHKALPAVKFDAEAILKGVKLCPTP